jgi:hypothetical protein
MVARTKVNLSEVDGPMQFVQQFINPWYWVPIFDGIFIQGPVINAHPHSAILLFHQHY